MCLPTSPVLYRCRNCHWTQVSSGGDVLAPGEPYRVCPQCGSPDPQRIPLPSSRGGLIGILSAWLGWG